MAKLNCSRWQKAYLKRLCGDESAMVTGIKLSGEDKNLAAFRLVGKAKYPVYPLYSLDTTA